MSNNALKSERIQIRMDTVAKAKIEQAANFAHRSVSSFILSSTLKFAEKVIQDNQRVELNDQDRDLFFEAVLNPPVPTKKLSEAFALHAQKVSKHA